MPKEVTAYTGMDALAHAVEAYTFRTALDGNIPVVDAVALEAIRLIGQNLVRAYENGNDLQSKGRHAVGSLLAGIALKHGSGETHAIGSMLAKYYGVCTVFPSESSCLTVWNITCRTDMTGFFRSRRRWGQILPVFL